METEIAMVMRQSMRMNAMSCLSLTDPCTRHRHEATGLPETYPQQSCRTNCRSHTKPLSRNFVAASRVLPRVRGKASSAGTHIARIDGNGGAIAQARSVASKYCTLPHLAPMQRCLHWMSTNHTMPTWLLWQLHPASQHAPVGRHRQCR